MAFSESFVAPVTACREAVAAGSVIVVANLDGCSEEPALQRIEVTANETAGATTISIQRTQITVDGTVVPAQPTRQANIRKGQVLRFGSVEVVADQDLNNIVNTPVALAIKPAPAAITSGTEAFFWTSYQLLGVTDLPVNLDSTDADRQDLDSGIQGQSVKTRVDLNVPLTYFANPLSDAHSRIILPAAVGTKDIYVMIIKASKTVAFGRAKVMGLQETGAVNTLISYSATLNFQAKWAYTYLTTDSQVNSATQLADLRTALTYSGFAQI